MATVLNVSAVQKDATSQLLSVIASRYNNNWDKLAIQFNKLATTEVKATTLKRYASGYADGKKLPEHVLATTLALVGKKYRAS